ncbi:MAG: sugar phosphate nucleotidyltransferase, partial [Candidatus Anstonellales archaeon]
MHSHTDCLILAAGQSKRFYPYENKLLFEVLGKPVIVHVINFLKKNFSSFYLVSKNEVIEKEVKKFFPELDIKTIIQETPLGTAHAVLQAENKIHNDFVVVAGDTIFDPNLVKQFLEAVKKEYDKYDKFLVSKRVQNSKDYGLIIEENNIVNGIIEKPSKEIEG